MRWLSRIATVGVALVLFSSLNQAWTEDLPAEQQQRDRHVVSPSGTVEDAIETVQMAKLMPGYPDGHFHPEKTITRAELASIVVKAFDLKNRERKPNKVVLKDVPGDYWAAQDIGLVVNQEIMEGYRDGYFYPDHPISRAEALSVIAQAYGVYQFDESILSAILSNYPDAAQIPDWARKSIATSLKAGFVDVPPTAQIHPLQPMTRGAMAYTLYQYLQRSNPTESQETP